MKVKSSFGPFLFALLAWMLPAPAFCQQPAGGLYHDPQYHFAAQPPPASKVYYTAEAGGNVGFEAHLGRDTFYVHAEPAPSDDMHDFIAKQQAVITALCTNAPAFSESETTLAGKPATEIRSVCASNDPDALGERRVIKVTAQLRNLEDLGTVVYTVGEVTSVKHETKTDATYQAMLSSFRLLD